LVDGLLADTNYVVVVDGVSVGDEVAGTTLVAPVGPWPSADPRGSPPFKMVVSCVNVLRSAKSIVGSSSAKKPPLASRTAPESSAS
jgi:hypothetical protein